MVIVNSDGDTFASRFDQLSQKFQPENSDQNSYHAGREEGDPRNRESTKSIDERNQDSIQGSHNQDAHERYERNIEEGDKTGHHEWQVPFHIWWGGGKVVDREHHVPLAASGILDENRNMVGLAIDHRIPSHPEFDQFVGLHEKAEIDHMRNLIDGGMDPGEAYHEAHDRIATPTETAAVRAHAVRNNMDPDQYLDQYKSFWRDAASVASQPTDRPVHPGAHTTVYGLDKAEGMKFTQNDEEHPPLQMDPRLNQPKGSTYNSGEPWEKVMVPGYGMRYVKSKNAWKFKGEDEDFGEKGKLSPFTPDEHGVLSREKTSMEGETDAPLHNRPLKMDALDQLQGPGGLAAGPGPVKMNIPFKGANENNPNNPEAVADRQWNEMVKGAAKGKSLSDMALEKVATELKKLSPDTRKYIGALFEQQQKAERFKRAKEAGSYEEVRDVHDLPPIRADRLGNVLDQKRNLEDKETGKTKGWADQLRSYFGLDKDDE